MGSTTSDVVLRSFCYDPSDMKSSASFRCDSCSMHRSSVTPGTAEGGHDSAASGDSSSSTTVILDDVMQQLKHIGDVMQQLKRCSGIVDSRRGLIHDSLAGLEHSMAGILYDVAELSASDQLLSETVAAFGARENVARSDFRNERRALRS